MKRPLPPRPMPDVPRRPRAAPLAAPVDVHIDIRRLSLHGFSPHEQQRFMRALSSALEQKATARRDWSAMASQNIGALPALQARPGSTPEESAHRLAGALFARLGANHAERGHG